EASVSGGHRRERPPDVRRPAGTGLEEALVLGSEAVIPPLATQVDRAAEDTQLALERQGTVFHPVVDEGARRGAGPQAGRADARGEVPALPVNEKGLVEAAGGGEGGRPDEQRCPGAPGGLTGLGVVGLRVLLGKGTGVDEAGIRRARHGPELAN